MGVAELQISCRKGEARPIGQLLRQITMTRLNSWRPIGFVLTKHNARTTSKNTTNILYSDGTVVQDMVELSLNLAELEFRNINDSSDSLDGKDFISETYTFRNELMSNALMSGTNMECLTPGVQLLNILNSDEYSLKVYFRKGCGSYSVNDNLNFLQSKLRSIDEIKVMTSVHSVVNTFTFMTEEQNLSEEVLKINLNTKSKDAYECLRKSVEIALDRLNSVSEALN